MLLFPWNGERARFGKWRPTRHRRLAKARASVPPLGHEMKKKRILFGVVAALLLVIAIPTYVVCDVCCHGPQVVRFNHRCNRIIEERALIGQTREAVEAALGTPTSVFTYDKPGSFTLNYAPHPSFPFAKFQAHFTDGKLKSTELFDD